MQEYVFNFPKAEFDSLYMFLSYGYCMTSVHAYYKKICCLEPLSFYT